MHGNAEQTTMTKYESAIAEYCELYYAQILKCMSYYFDKVGIKLVQIVCKT